MSIKISEDSPIYNAVKEIAEAQAEAEVGWSLNIPMWVYHSDEISSLAKLLYGRIMSFTGKRNGRPKYCYASNSFFANELRVSERSIQILIDELVEAGMVERVVERGKDGTQRFLVPILAVGGGCKKLHPGGEENFTQVSRDKVKGSSSSSLHSEDSEPSSFSPAPQAPNDLGRDGRQEQPDLFPSSTSIANDKIAGKTYTIGTRVVARWNTVAVFGKVRSFDAKRQTALRKLMKEVPDFEETWEKALDMASRNSFLRGENKRGWKLDFDSFLTPRIYNRILEDAYDKGAKSKNDDEYGLCGI